MIFRLSTINYITEMYNEEFHAVVTQLGECCAEDADVAGSSPAHGTILNLKPTVGGRGVQNSDQQHEKNGTAIQPVMGEYTMPRSNNKSVAVNDTRTFRPRATVYLMCLGILVLILLGAFYLFIEGATQSNVEDIILSIIGSIAFLYMFIVLTREKVVLTDEYIFATPGAFARDVYNQKETQKIPYSEIEKIELAIGIFQFIMISLKSKKTIVIYVKTFTKKHVYQMLDEIKRRVEIKNPDADLSQLYEETRLSIRDLLT